jgi:hypothetical protein
LYAIRDEPYLLSFAFTDAYSNAGSVANSATDAFADWTGICWLGGKVGIKGERKGAALYTLYSNFVKVAKALKSRWINSLPKFFLQKSSNHSIFTNFSLKTPMAFENRKHKTD